MAAEVPETVAERCGVKEGEIISRENSAWGSFIPEAGDLLEFRLSSNSGEELEARVAFLVTGVTDKELMTGRYLGSSNEDIAKHCVNKINRKGLPLHLCREKPCAHLGPEVAAHLTRLAWWQPKNFEGQYLRSWGTQVLKQWMETQTIKRRKKSKDSGAPKTAPEKRKGPPKGGRIPLRGRRRVVAPSRGDVPLTGKGKGSGDRGGSKDLSKLGQLRDRLAGLRDKLRGPGRREDPEVIDVEAWSGGLQSGEDYDYAEDQLAEMDRDGDQMDPGTSHLALATAVKQEDTKGGILREKGREVRKVRVKKRKRKAKGPSSQLLQVAELQQKRKAEEKKKKEKKSKSSGSKGVKELVKLLGGKKKRKRKDEDSPDPSGSDSSEYDESEDSSSSSDSQMLAPLQKKSLKQPGAVLKMLTRHARQTLDQTAVLEVGNGEEITAGVKMATYFNLLIRPYHPATSRDMKELHYLSICMDELRAGKLGALGDSLASRFLAVHSAVNEGGWRTAQHLELHPLEGAQSAPTPLLLQARRHSKLVARSHGKDESDRGWRKSGDKGWWREEWQDSKGKKGAKGKGKGRGKGGYGKQDNWQGWQRDHGDKGNWWDKNKEKGGKDENKEKKGDK